MSNDLVLNLRIRANADGTAQVLGQTSEGIRRVSTESGNASNALRGMESAASGVIRTIAPLVGMYELINFGEKVVRDTATVQDLSTRLHTLTKEAGDYAQTVGYINTVADVQHKKINDLTDSYAKLRNLQNSGLITQQRTKEFFEGINDAVSANGVSNDQLKQSVFGLAQSLSVLNAENFNQVMEPIPGLLQEMDKAAGLAAGGFKRMVVEGTVTTQFFSDTLAKALHHYDGAAAAASQNINAKLTDIENSWTRLITKMEQPLSLNINPALDELNSLLRATSEFNGSAVIGGIVAIGEVTVTVFAGKMLISIGQYTAAKYAAITVEQAHAAAITQNLQANVAAADALMAEVAATQAAIIAARESAVAQLPLVNAKIAQAQATIAATSATVQSTSVLYIHQQAVTSLALAEQQRNAVLAELALLGAQQTRITAAATNAATAQAAAIAAQSAATVTFAGSLTLLKNPINLVNIGLAAMVGWEIGGWLNKFETVRITATATLGSILQIAEDATYYWNRAQIVMSSGDNKEARLDFLKQSHLAAKKAIDDNIVSTIAWELNGRKATESTKQLAGSQNAGTTATEQSTQAIQKAIKALEQQAKYQAELAKVTNTGIDAQIKDIDRLTVAKTASLDAERKANDFAFEQHKISAQAHLDMELALIDKATNAKVDALNQQAALQKTKLDEQVTDVDKAYEAIRMIESKNQAGQVNKSTFALGQGQVLPSTLANPGFGMSAYTDSAAIGKLKGDYKALVDYVKAHETELANWGKSYFEHLVVYYKSIPEAVKHYGDGTAAYMSKYRQNAALINGSTINQIKLTGEQKDIEAEIAKVVADGQAQKTAALQKSITESQTYVRALEDERVKLLELTGEATKAREAKAALALERNPAYQQARLSGNAADAQIFRDANAADLFNANTAAANAYQDKLDAINKSTKDVGITSTEAFDVINKGFGGLVGTFNSLSDSIDKATNALVDNAKKARDAANDKTLDPKQRADLAAAYAAKEKTLEADRVKTALTGTRQIASAYREMLDKNTSEYKAAHAVEMALAGAELAMQVMKITGIGLETAANVQSVVPYVGATMTKAEADATAGVASQAKAGPFIGFALMAAMAAAMAGLGLMSGKSSVSPGPQGMASDTGTVLGDSTAKSESIDKTYQLLKDIHASEYATLRSIDQGIASLHSGITDVITRLFQAGGLTTVKAPPSQITGIHGMLNSIDPIGSMGFDPIGQFLLGGIFGGKQTSTVTAQGISTNPTALLDILAGANLSAQQFAQIETKTSGGWFGKDKYSTRTQYAALDAATQKALNDVFKSMGSTMMGLADNLGMGLSDRVKNYVIPALSVDLKGLDGEAAAKKLNGVLSAALDTMSASVFGDVLGQYQQLGEGMLETAVRVVAEIAVVEDALSKSGLSISGDAIAISDSLAQAAGGLQEFQKQFDNYYQKFYTDAERHAFTQRQLNSQLSDVNVLLPATRDGYRKVIEALDINNAADQQRYSMLLKLSDAADSYYQTIESQAEDAQRIAQQRRALDIEYMTLSSRALGALIERRKDELAALDPSLRWRQQAVWAASEANKAIDDAMATLKKSVADQKALNASAHQAKIDALTIERQSALEGMTIQKQAATDMLNSLKTVAANIKTALGSTVIESQTYMRKRRADAQDVLSAALSAAQAGGSLANFKGLDQALVDIAKPSEQLHATFVDYAIDQARTGAVISSLGEHATAQISVAEQTLAAIEANTKQVSASIEASTKELRATLEADNAALDALITTAQAQIDAARGTTAEVMSVKDAVDNLARALEVRSQTLKAIESANAATAFADAAKKIADDANSKAQSSADALAAQIALSEQATKAAADAQRDATAKATWQPAPATWRNGQTDNPLWERVLSEFNAWHAGRYGIEMNRPWSADGDARAAYGRLVAQYNAMSASAASAAQASASALAATADAIKTAIPNYQAVADADAMAASTANADAAAKAAAAGAAQSAAVEFEYIAPGGAAINKLADKFYNAFNGLTVSASNKKDNFEALRRESGFAAVYELATKQGLDSKGLDMLMDWAPGTSSAKAFNWKLPAFASGGEHTGGFRLVGEQGPEIEFTPPSRIFSHSQSKSLVDNSELVDEIKALKAVAAELLGELSEIKKNTGGTESNSRRVADQLRSMTPDGQSLRVTTA